MVFFSSDDAVIPVKHWISNYIQSWWLFFSRPLSSWSATCWYTFAPIFVYIYCTNWLKCCSCWYWKKNTTVPLMKVQPLLTMTNTRYVHLLFFNTRGNECLIRGNKCLIYIWWGGNEKAILCYFPCRIIFYECADEIALIQNKRRNTSRCLARRLRILSRCHRRCCWIAVTWMIW